MQVKIDGNDLVIRIPMQQPKPSSSGKNLVIASTSGNVRVDCNWKDKPVTIGLNAWVSAK